MGGPLGVEAAMEAEAEVGVEEEVARGGGGTHWRVCCTGSQPTMSIDHPQPPLPRPPLSSSSLPSIPSLAPSVLLCLPTSFLLNPLPVPIPSQPHVPFPPLPSPLSTHAALL